MAESYDMRSNIKNKPGSQGTLFQVKDKGLLNPQQRWPQGYTPERLNEVREATGPIPVSAPSHFYDQPSSETQQMHGTNEFGYRERLNREIAKTTVPGTDLKGIKEITGDSEPGTKGTYWSGRKELQVDLTRGKSDDVRKTLTHEIGHHVDNMSNRNEHLYNLTAQVHAYKAVEDNEWRDKPTETDLHMAKSRVDRGVGEAVADNYAVEHYRSGGRKSTGTTTGAYEEDWTTSSLDRSYPGYTDVRPPEPGPTHRALQHAQFNPGLFSVSQARDGSQTELQRRLGAQIDAVRRAVGENL